MQLNDMHSALQRKQDTALWIDILSTTDRLRF